MKPITTIFFLVFIFCVNAQSNRYISETPIYGLNQLDSIVKNYTVFFTGENHTFTKENNQIELEMLKYLNKQVNLQHFIIELGYARGYMLNAYINNDTTYFDCLRHTTSPKYIELYQAMRKLNLSLPIEKRIQVHGVDVERFTDDGPILLNELLPKNVEAPKTIEFDLEVLKTYAEYAKNKYFSYSSRTEEPAYNNISYYSSGFNEKGSIDSIISQYYLHQADYKLHLASNYEVFDKVILSLTELRKWQNFSQLPHQTIYRERMIYNNISQLILKYPDGKFFGQFGRCHTGFETDNACNWYQLNSTAIRLNEGIAKGKTLSIGIFYNTDKKSTYQNGLLDNELNKYLVPECSGNSTLSKVALTDTSLIKHFPYILYNNPCGNGKLKSTKNLALKREDDIYEWATLLDFGYGQSFYNFDRVNKNMKLPGNGFNTLIQSVSFGYTYSDFGNYNIGRYDQHITQKITQNNINYSLSGYDIMEGYGYRPHISKRFSIGFYGLLSYSRMAILVEDDSSAYVPVIGFSSIKRYKFTNDALAIGAGIDFRYAITHTLGLFVRGRYLTDLSKKYWHNTGGGYGDLIDANSPKFSHNNANIQVGFSINIGS